MRPRAKTRTRERGRARRGTIAVVKALILGPLPIGLLAVVQDWHVDVNADCETATGSQAAPFCTIQSAVDAASDGDTIHIAPGTYFENVLIEKDLELIGIGGQEATHLDGGAMSSVVTVNGYDSTASFTGLTFMNGAGSFGGGGIRAFGTLILTSCTVSGNSATNSISALGGGILSWGPATLTDCRVSENVAQSFAFGSTGGGIVGFDQLTLTNCTVSGNSAYDAGGVFAVGPISLARSKISGNTALYGDGGGLWLSGSGSITNSTIYDNSAFGYTDHGRGGGIWAEAFAYDAQVTLTNSTVTGNRASHRGGGIGLRSYFDLGYYDSSNTLTLVNGTISGNVAALGGDAIYAYADGPADCTVEAVNSLFWGTGTNPIELVGPNASASVDHSVVQGGWPGTGNLNADPLFRDPMNGNYKLLPDSPAIDAGDNLAVPIDVETDLRGAPRIINGRVDMGAYEYFERWKRVNVPVTIAPPRTVR